MTELHDYRFAIHLNPPLWILYGNVYNSTKFEDGSAIFVSTPTNLWFDDYNDPIVSTTSGSIYHLVYPHRAVDLEYILDEIRNIIKLGKYKDAAMPRSAGKVIY